MSQRSYSKAGRWVADAVPGRVSSVSGKRVPMPSSSACVVSMALFLLALFAGCEESVDPVLETDRAFSVYGFFNPRADTQSVRVFPIEGILEPTPPEPIDAHLVSTDLMTGEERVWQDSLVLFDNNTYGHVFWSPFRADFDHRYHLEVVRSDGAAAQAEATVPPESEATILEPVLVLGQVTLPVRWEQAPQLLQQQMVYTVEVLFGQAPVDTLEVVVPYAGPSTPEQGGRRFDVALSDDLAEIVAVFARRNGSLFNISFVLLNINMRVMVVSDAWDPPGGVFDADVLVEPGTFSNVSNGFGFVGAGYPASIHWLPAPEILAEAGFVVR